MRPEFIGAGAGIGAIRGAAGAIGAIRGTCTCGTTGVRNTGDWVFGIWIAWGLGACMTCGVYQLWAGDGAQRTAGALD